MANRALQLAHGSTTSLVVVVVRRTGCDAGCVVMCGVGRCEDPRCDARCGARCRSRSSVTLSASPVRG